MKLEQLENAAEELRAKLETANREVYRALTGQVKGPNSHLALQAAKSRRAGLEKQMDKLAAEYEAASK